MTLPHNGTATSRAAAESVRGHSQADADRIADLIARSGGMTCDEVEVALGLSHQTASARINGLVKARRITATEQRRPTRSGRAAAVYVVPVERTFTVKGQGVLL